MVGLESPTPYNTQTQTTGPSCTLSGGAPGSLTRYFSDEAIMNLTGILSNPRPVGCYTGPNSTRELEAWWYAFMKPNERT